MYWVFSQPQYDTPVLPQLFKGWELQKSSRRQQELQANVFVFGHFSVSIGPYLVKICQSHWENIDGDFFKR